MHEVFTPGIHSPNAFCSEEESFTSSIDKNSVTSEKSKLFINANLTSKNIEIKEINQTRKNIKKTLDNYFKLIPSEFLFENFSLNELIQECEAEEDASFF